MKTFLTVIGLFGILATPALAGSHERNFVPRETYVREDDRFDVGREERDFVHAEARRSHHVEHAALTKSKSPSCCEVVVKAAAKGAVAGALGGAAQGLVTEGPAGVVPGVVEGAISTAAYKAIDTATTDPACTEKKDSEKKESKAKGPDKKDPDHSRSA